VPRREVDQRVLMKRKCDEEVVADGDVEGEEYLVDGVTLGDIDIIPAVDEFKALLWNASDAMICAQLWDVFCGHVGDGIFEDKLATGRLMDIYELCHVRFYELMGTFKRFKYYEENVLEYLEEKKLPAVFIEFVQVKCDKDPSKKFLKDHPLCSKLPIPQIRQRQFGFFVWSSFSASRATIRNHFNVYWKECNLRRGVSPSGVNNTSGLLRAIRCRSYFRYSWKKLEESVKGKKAYAALKNRPPLFASDEEEAQFKRDAMAEKIAAGPPNTYYPDEWLAFLLFGKPAGDRGLRRFGDGKDNGRSNESEILSAVTETSSKKQRRAAASAVVNMQEEGTPDSTISSPPGKVVTIKLDMVRNAGWDVKLRIIKESIDAIVLYKQHLGRSDKDDALAELLAEYDEALRQLRSNVPT